LNSCAGVESVIRGGEPEILPGAVFRATDAVMAAVFAVASLRSLPETILLVEDEAFVRKVTAEVLESAGYRLIIAGSAAEALEACHGFPASPDLLVADIVMPGMSGRQLAAKLETYYPRVRILLMSGYAEQLGRGELSPYGREYLAKPFSISTLLTRVREVLDEPLDGGCSAALDSHAR